MKFVWFLIVALIIASGYFMSQYFSAREAAAVAKVQAQGAATANNQFNSNQWLNAGAGVLLDAVSKGLNQLFGGSKGNAGGTTYGGYSF